MLWAVGRSPDLRINEFELPSRVIPVASFALALRAYSGGAVPDSHRLPNSNQTAKSVDCKEGRVKTYRATIHLSVPFWNNLNYLEVSNMYVVSHILSFRTSGICPCVET